MMDSSVRKRWTREHQADFSALPADVSHHAALFIKLCDSNELRMRQVVDDLQDISAKLQRLQSRSEKCSVLGVFSAAVGVGAALAVLIAQVSGGLSLAASAAAGYVAAAAAVFAFRAKTSTTEEELVKKIKEFLDIVTLLQSELENIQRLCEDVQRESSGAETESVFSLRTNVLQQFLTVAKLRGSITAGCVTELSDQCENVFDQFRNVKRSLEEELRGRGEAENVQTLQTRD
ncbi:hypothetical protein EXN66_Car017356 [Channa argus]|uniref:Uncharacterized protein n=1 Tax=Channa argus TaxID=215402 RepID=A0A6G1QHE8_CHAAH|nr:hypothetical protein EXN66_Car017356 [Channa argus]